VANGHVVDYVEGLSQSITYPQQNQLFLGDGDGRFRNVSSDCGKPFSRKRVSRGAAFGDYDNDGDIDILVSNSGQRAELLRNDLPGNQRWMKIRLEGRSPNTGAIGAKVAVHLGSDVRRAEVRNAPSYLSSSDPTLHFGLPQGVVEATVEVTWPSGQSSKHRARAGKLSVIEEPAADQPR